MGGGIKDENVPMEAIDNGRDVKPDMDAAAIERIASPTDIQKEQNYSRIDPEVAKYTTGEYVEVSEAESKRLRRLIDTRVLPITIVTYFLQALDKGTMSFTSIMGIREDTNLKGQEYSWLTTCIYIAILIVEYPINRLVQILPIGKFLGTAIIGWGAILCLHAACHNFKGLVTVRTLLGIFEAVCQPTFLVMSGMWYKRSEQAETGEIYTATLFFSENVCLRRLWVAVTYWYMMNGGQQIVGGLLAYCFSLIPEGRALASWQAIFIAYGCLSVLYGLFVLYWLPDSPMRAKCFSEDDKRKMIERVRSNETGLQNKTFRPEQVKEALLDIQTWCYCFIQICTTLPTSGLGAFANIIISGFGFTVLQTQLLAMVLGAFIIVILLTSTWLVKKTQQNLWVMLGFVVPSFVGTIVLMTVHNDGQTSTEAGLLISYYIVLSFWAAQTLGMSLLSRNIAGQTKKSICVTLNFVSWAAGNAIGPQVFLKWDAPRYFIAFATHIGCYALLVLIIFLLRWHLKRQNQLRDRLAAEGISEAADASHQHAFEDLTDQ
ncbi:MFS general substrate transporter, partial [Hortaea werneckii]